MVPAEWLEVPLRGFPAKIPTRPGSAIYVMSGERLYDPHRNAELVFDLVRNIQSQPA